MTNQDHPSFPNPTIGEALCEVHFTYPTDKEWRASLAGELFKAIQEEFPSMEPRLEAGVQLEVGAHGIGHRLLPPTQRVLFRHASKNLLLQLGEGIITMNVLHPYPGWKSMEEDLAAIWERSSGVLKPTTIIRIGLRYINRIPRASREQPAEKWLKPTDFLPAAALQSKSSFFSQVSVDLDDSNRIVVTLAENRAEAGNEIVFDIDRIVEREIVPSPVNLLDEVSQLHQHIWEVFSSAMDEGLEEELNRKDLS